MKLFNTITLVMLFLVSACSNTNAVADSNKTAGSAQEISTNVRSADDVTPPVNAIEGAFEICGANRIISGTAKDHMKDLGQRFRDKGWKLVPANMRTFVDFLVSGQHSVPKSRWANTLTPDLSNPMIVTDLVYSPGGPLSQCQIYVPIIFADTVDTVLKDRFPHSPLEKQVAGLSYEKHWKVGNAPGRPYLFTAGRYENEKEAAKVATISARRIFILKYRRLSGG